MFESEYVKDISLKCLLVYITMPDIWMYANFGPHIFHANCGGRGKNIFKNMICDWIDPGLQNEKYAHITTL